MITVCGSAERGFKQGKCLTEAKLCYPYGICVDPLRPLCFYVGDTSSIRYVDTEADTVSLIAGTERNSFADGVGAAAVMDVVYDLLCTSGGDRLYFTDYSSDRLRSADVKTQTVVTIAHGGFSQAGIGSISRPRKLLFDRSPSVKPDSVLYITSARGICHFELDTAEMTTCEWRGPTEFDPWGIDATPSGHLIVSCCNTQTIYSFDPRTCEHAVLAGPGVTYDSAGYTDGSGPDARFDRPFALVVAEHERCVFICDTGNEFLRHMTLPRSFFSV